MPKVLLPRISNSGTIKPTNGPAIYQGIGCFKISNILRCLSIFFRLSLRSGFERPNKIAPKKEKYKVLLKELDVMAQVSLRHPSFLEHQEYFINKIIGNENFKLLPIPFWYSFTCIYNCIFVY